MIHLSLAFLITVSLGLYASDKKEIIFDPSDVASKDVWPLISAYAGCTKHRSILVHETQGTAEERVWCTAWHPKEISYASAGTDGKMYIWDTKTDQRISTSSMCSSKSYGTFTIDYSHDGRLVVSGDGEGVLRIWDPLNGTTKESWRAHFTHYAKSSLYRAIFNSDSSFIASCGDDYCVKISDLSKRQTLIAISTSATLMDLKWIDHNILICAESLGHIKSFDTRSKEKIISIATCNRLYVGGQQVAVTPDGITVMYQNDISINSLDRRKPEKIRKLISSDAKTKYQSVNCNPTTNCLIVCSSGKENRDSESTIALYTIDGEYIDSVTPIPKSGNLTQANCSPDGSKILAGDYHGYLHKWEQQDLFSFLNDEYQRCKSSATPKSGNSLPPDPS